MLIAATTNQPGESLPGGILCFAHSVSPDPVTGVLEILREVCNGLAWGPSRVAVASSMLACDYTPAYFDTTPCRNWATQVPYAERTWLDPVLERLLP